MEVGIAHSPYLPSLRLFIAPTLSSHRFLHPLCSIVPRSPVFLIEHRLSVLVCWNFYRVFSNTRPNRKMIRRNEDCKNPLHTSHSPTPSSSYFPDAKTALSTIRNCIQELSNMQHMFFTLSQSESVDEEMQDNVLDIKYNVVCWLEGLFKETEEGGQTPLLTSHSPSSMMVESSSCFRFPNASTALFAISECFQELVKMRHGILQILFSHSQGDTIDKLQLEILRIKSNVVCRLEMVFKETEEANDDAMDLEGNEDSNDEATDVEGNESCDEYEEGFAPIFVPDPKELGKYYRLLSKVQFKWSSVYEKELNEEERYLCVSNGYEIWCLDLKKSLRYLPVLPKISNLSILGQQQQQLPASVGLFKLGSDAYLIGGQHLPDSLNPKSWDKLYYGKNPRGINLYSCLCSSMGIKGSSCATYGLSLAAANKEDGTLSLSHNKACTDTVPELNNPKVWPIVEKIGGKLHVIDSIPFLLGGSKQDTFTHEVCTLGGGGGWKVVDVDVEEKVQIKSHVVVGDRIYAITHGGASDAYYYMMFDSKTEKWEAFCLPKQYPDPKTRRLWDIISYGFGRCTAEFQHPRVWGGEKLYVMVALEPDCATFAMAYLVTLTGQVVCYQKLPDFFPNGEPLQQPCSVTAGTMIHVDEGDKTKMCSVFTGTLRQDLEDRDHVFVNTFSVTITDEAAVGRMLVEKASEVEAGDAFELDFVRLVPNNWYIFRTDARSKRCFAPWVGRFVGWRACFLTPP